MKGSDLFRLQFGFTRTYYALCSAGKQKQAEYEQGKELHQVINRMKVKILEPTENRGKA
jgi:hypothetical protein